MNIEEYSYWRQKIEGMAHAKDAEQLNLLTADWQIKRDVALRNENAWNRAFAICSAICGVLFLYIMFMKGAGTITGILMAIFGIAAFALKCKANSHKYVRERYNSLIDRAIKRADALPPPDQQ